MSEPTLSQSIGARNLHKLYEFPFSGMEFTPFNTIEDYFNPVPNPITNENIADWIHLSLNDKLRRVYNRTALAEKSLNTTAHSLPGYLKTYLRTVTNPVFTKQWVLTANNEINGPEKYMTSSIFDSYGVAYDWDSDFWPGVGNVCIFPLTEITMYLNNETSIFLIYLNGRPLDPRKYVIYKQITGYSLFIPLSQLSEYDVIDVEIRRIWNRVRYSADRDGYGNLVFLKQNMGLALDLVGQDYPIQIPAENTTFKYNGEFSDYNNLGTLYNENDIKIYIKPKFISDSLNGNIKKLGPILGLIPNNFNYFRLIDPNQVNFTFQKVLENDYLLITFYGYFNSDGTPTNSMEEEFEAIVLNNSSTWSVNFINGDSYLDTIPLIVDKSYETQTQNLVATIDPSDVDNYENKVPLPVISEDELTVLVNEPPEEFASKDHTNSFKLVPHKDFVLRNKLSSDKLYIDEARVSFYGYSNELKHTCQLLLELFDDNSITKFTDNNGEETFFSNYDNDTDIDLFCTNLNYVNDLIFLNLEEINILTIYDFDCIVKSRETIKHFTECSLPKHYFTKNDLEEIAYSQHPRNLRDIALWMFKYFPDASRKSDWESIPEGETTWELTDQLKKFVFNSILLGGIKSINKNTLNISLFTSFISLSNEERLELFGNTSSNTWININNLAAFHADGTFNQNTLLNETLISEDLSNWFIKNEANIENFSITYKNDSIKFVNSNITSSFEDFEIPIIYPIGSHNSIMNGYIFSNFKINFSPVMVSNLDRFALYLCKIEDLSYNDITHRWEINSDNGCTLFFRRHGFNGNILLYKDNDTNLLHTFPFNNSEWNSNNIINFELQINRNLANFKFTLTDDLLNNVIYDFDYEVSELNNIIDYNLGLSVFRKTKTPWDLPVTSYIKAPIVVEGTNLDVSLQYRPTELVLARPLAPNSSIQVIKSDSSEWFEDKDYKAIISSDGLIQLPERDDNNITFPIAPQFAEMTLNNKHVSKKIIESITDRNLRIKSPSIALNENTNYILGNNSFYFRSNVIKHEIIEQLIEDYSLSAAYITDLERYLRVIDFAPSESKIIFNASNIIEDVGGNYVEIPYMNYHPHINILKSDGEITNPNFIKYTLDNLYIQVGIGSLTEGNLILR